MHLLSEMFAAKSGVQFLHVPYKVIAQMVTAVLAGEVDFTWVGVYSARPQVNAGKLKAIGYGATRRTQYFPDVPTFGEAGYPDVEMPVWYGIMGPAALARSLAQKIHEDVAAVIADPEFCNREIAGTDDIRSLSSSRYTRFLVSGCAPIAESRPSMTRRRSARRIAGFVSTDCSSAESFIAFASERRSDPMRSRFPVACPRSITARA